MNRSFALTDVVLKTSVNTTVKPAIAAGKTLRIVTIGMTDESKTAKPSIVRLKFGGQIFRVLCATTGTVQIPVNLEFVGDGVNFLSVDRENTESNDKPITVWVDAYDNA